MDGSPESGRITPGSCINFQIDAISAGQRVDVFLTTHFQHYSRSFFKRIINDGGVLVNGNAAKSSHPLQINDTVAITFPVPPTPPEIKPFDPSIGVEIVGKHKDFLVVYKPAGLLVHRPDSYSSAVTLVDWLVSSYNELVQVGVEGRPAIVHRLDKDTSGLLIIPRNSPAYMTFGNMFRDRSINKEYLAIVEGTPELTGTIDLAIGRDPVHKHKMIHCPRSGPARSALTHYRLLASNGRQSLIQVHPVTGRTHQIRVHCAAIGHPVVGDPVYGTPSKLIKRQALHAHRISFTYNGQPYTFTHEPPEDMRAIISTLTTIEN